MLHSTAVPGMALWGGMECTVNRIGTDFFSQLDRSTYASDVGDLDRFAALGITALRFPVLWERVTGSDGKRAEWSWSDTRLDHLRKLGIMPIAGLVHHGSGPANTSLVDPGFGEKLADYAGSVARRYPWIDHYTPINEPLTTARFSGLYGLWYPHGRDAPTFWKALLNQCRGIVLAMRAIETVNPLARLVQTEDLGVTSGSPSVAYQARFNNEMRWLSWDLLSGRVDEHHALWGWLRDCCDATIGEILWFRDNPRTPDIVGINHYVTSDRFLDEDIHRYPAHLHGGNGRDAYVDVEATRSLAAPGAGVGPLIADAWERYGLPIAITEVHLDATREDQMRWLAEIWTGATDAKSRGADVRAITAWSLLGSHEWNSLLTQSSGYYESGAFDVRCGRARPTAIARLLSQLARDGTGDHPVLDGAGWWRRPERLLFERTSSGSAASKASVAGTGRRPILIVGASGTLGSAFARICAERDLACQVMSREELDISDASSVSAALDRHQPWAVINAAGYVRVDDAEADAERCFRENAIGPAVLAERCERNSVALMTFSTDLVFDGRQDAPYLETDEVRPLNVYGKSKVRAEILVQARYPGALVIRTSAFFGPWDRHNFVTSTLRSLRAGNPAPVSNDLTISPTYVPDLVHASLDLLIDDESGIWHLTNGEALTWGDFALRAAKVANIDASRLRGCTYRSLRLRAPRPLYSALGSARIFTMPSLEDALQRYSCRFEAPALAA